MDGNSVGQKYTIRNAIAKGSFGEIYNGENAITHQKVAIKFEPLIINNEAVDDTRYDIEKKLNKSIPLDYRFYLEQRKPKKQKAHKPQVLLYECRTLRYLNGALGFPSIYWYGYHENSNSYALVMDLLDSSISDLFKKFIFKIQSEFNFNSKNNTIQRLHENQNIPKLNHFSLKTVLMIADQMISRLEFLHKKGIIHCDIKPENMLLGRGYNSNVIYLIDFGLSKRFIDENGNHIKYGENSFVCGTARYMSINCHLGINLSRRDDMESLGYVLIFLLKGSLPWQGLAKQSKRKTSNKMLELSKAMENQEALPSHKKTNLYSLNSSDKKECANDSCLRYENTINSKYRDLHQSGLINDANAKADLYMKIAEMKLKTPLQILCNGIPEEFQTYMQQVRSLRFEDEPDYSFYRQLFRSLFNKAGYTYDMKFDWVS